MSIRALLVALAAGLAAAVAVANTYTVTSTADSGAGTLRQAILDANANPGADTIAFSITGSGVHTIAPASALPGITDAVTIDGYTQPGSSPNTHAVGEGLDTVLMIEIDGTAAGPNGLVAQAQNVTIRGLVVNRFPAYQIEGSGFPYNTAHFVVEGCFVGTTPDGLHASGAGPGVDAEHQDIRIGGLTPAARNLIAKEVHLEGQGVAQGNLIGTDATGLRAAAPGTPSGRGVYLYGGNALMFGGTDPNAANVVAGVDEGLRLESPNSTVQGNYFGVDAGLTGVIPGGSTGIVNISTGVIGGAGPGEGNVIGGFDTGVLIGNPVTFQGNAVGTDPSGTRNLGNRINGVYVASGILSIGGINPGEANLIAFNGWVGILVDSFAKKVTMRGNRIFENGLGGTPAGGFQGIGIDLASAVGPDGATANDPGDGDSGNGSANDFQNFPLITSAAPEGGGTRVIGTLNSKPSAVFDLDFYGNPACRPRPRALLQGETYLGTAQVTTDAGGNASFNVLLSTPIEAGAPVTATATDSAGNTSEFWNPILFRDSPGVGGPGDNNSQDLFGQLFEPGATITVGGTPIAGVAETSSTRRDVRRPLPHARDRLRHRAGEPERAFRHPAQWLRVAFPGRRCRNSLRSPDRAARGQRRHGRLRRRQLLPELQRHAQTDGRLRAQGEAWRLLRSSPVRRSLSGRSVQLELRPVDRGVRGRRNHRRLRQRQLLPRRERAARPDGRLPPEGKVRVDLHSAALRRSLRRRRMPLDVRGLDRGARGRRRHRRLRQRQLLSDGQQHARDRWRPFSSRP